MFNRKSNKLEMVLGENSKVTGDVASLGTILVEGTILGNLECEKVILGEKAYVKGNISSNTISVAGKIEGNLLGRESVEIKNSAQISGDITTKSLSMVDGAVFNGMCRMDGAQQGRVSESDKNVVEFATLER
jgi:cytoskeletal protein CcmA (bactofilin family)